MASYDTTGAVRVNEWKSLLLLALVIGCVGGGVWLALPRTQTEPVASAPAGTAPAGAGGVFSPGGVELVDGVNRIRGEGIFLKKGWAVARIGRSGFDGSLTVMRAGGDYEARRLAESVERAVNEPSFAQRVGLSPEQIAKLKAVGLTVSRRYTPQEIQKIIGLYQAWTQAADKPAAAVPLLEAVAAAGETVELKPEFPAKLAQVQQLVTPEQLETLRSPWRATTRATTTTRPATRATTRAATAAGTRPAAPSTRSATRATQGVRAASTRPSPGPVTSGPATTAGRSSAQPASTGLEPASAPASGPASGPAGPSR